ncbi:MAG: glycosyltransferase family 2 protein [Butyricimonas virosa]|uniref:glycosyltransferase family 2 protein n=1 Tax=Butyricimonas virosa TaxID=544645 RepID=UPI002A821008|nr:glycosyltransferase family 2 protein [Butyricimonas virosa]MDY4903578.1 glycosyltransferase family 2 protein [Butyricimonas virosa]
MKDKVSVVMPVYKVEDCITVALESIVKQTYKNIELILVNDGSPDNSIPVAKDFLSKYDLDWKILDQQNMGLPTARNNGIKAASGEWIICPDSDDYLASQAIEKMLEAAEVHHSNCVFCGFKNVHDEDYRSLPKYERGSSLLKCKDMRRRFLERTIIPLVPGMLLKKNVYDTLKYDKDCPYDEDIHFMWQLFYTLESIVYVDADYYNYYIRSGSMVHNLKPASYLKTSQRYKELTDRLKETFPDDDVVARIYPKYRLGGAHVLARANDYATFKKTILEDGYRKDMGKLVFQPNIKLVVYTAIYCLSLRLFYLISK